MKQIGSLLRRRNFYIVAILAIALGAMAGIVTIVFELLLQTLQELVWTSIPSSVAVHQKIYPIIALGVGGLIVGTLVHFWGEYPDSIEAALSNYKKTHTFDYKHLPQAFTIAVLSLGFGAALGPEAGLTAIIGGLATWIGLQLKKVIKLAGIEYLTIGSVVGAVFHSPLGGAFIADESSKKSGLDRVWLSLCGIIAGLVGWQVYKLGASGENYFDLGVISYTFQAIDLLGALLPTAAGIVAGICLALSGKYLNQLFKPLRSKRYISATIGGVGFGLLVLVSPLLLFSGHEGVRDIVNDYASMGATTLIIVGLLKTIAAGLCLATGWKGGQFFPAMFAGAAVGTGVALLFPFVPAMLGLAAGLAATLGVLLKKPVAAILLAVFFFPLSLWPAVAVAAVVGAFASQRLAKLI